MADLSKIAGRFEVEQLIRQLAGGASPGHGQVLKYDKEAGWKFSNSGLLLVIEDPDNPGEEIDLEVERLKFQNGLFIVEQDEVADSQANVLLTEPFGVGNISGDVTLDYLNGAVQYMTVIGNTVLQGPINMRQGSPMLISMFLGGDFSVSFNTDDFITEEPVISPPLSYIHAQIMDFGWDAFTALVSTISVPE